MSLHEPGGWASTVKASVDGWMLAQFDDAWPPLFAEACRYPLETGGKRIRSLLTVAAAEAVGAMITPTVIAAAGAVELVHGYSLVHDDLPAMDDDDERRGRPTVHKAYDDATGILVGDAMLTAAFRALATLDAPAETRVKLIAELSQAAGHPGMIGGQAMDVGMAGDIETVEQLVRLHRGKTGALIRAAVRMGGIVAGADEAALEHLSTYGAAIGLAFQMADDVLDADEDAGADGPPSYVKLLGTEATQERAQALCADALAALTELNGTRHLETLARYAVEREH